MKTKNQIKVGMRVRSGEGEDADTGRVDAISGDTAIVAWDSLVVTPCPLELLEPEPDHCVRDLEDWAVVLSTFEQYTAAVLFVSSLKVGDEKP